MKRICIITRNFPPLKGGMERLNERLFQLLAERYEVVLYGPKGCRAYVKDGTAYGTRVSPTVFFIFISFLRAFFGVVLGRRFDYFLGGSGLVAPAVVSLARIFGGRAVILIHGLDIIVESAIYQRCFMPFVRAADLLVCNSENTARLAVENGVEPQRVVVVSPGAESPTVMHTKDEAKKLLGADGTTILLSVGRLIPRKGIAEFIEYSLPSLVAEDSKIEFWIAGTEPKRALKKNEFSVTEQIKQAIDRNNLTDKVKLLGSVDEQQLALLYTAADVFVFPLREVKGDVEGFGMVAVEAAGYGTPTVAFDNGGVKDAVINNETGILVEADKYGAFAKSIKRAAVEFHTEKIVEFARGFSWERYGAEFCGQLERFADS